MILFFENESQYIKVQDIRVKNNEIYYNILYSFVEAQDIDKDIKGVRYRMKVDINRGGKHNLIDILGVADAISIVGCSIEYELIGMDKNNKNKSLGKVEKVEKVFVILNRNEVTPMISLQTRGTLDVICYTFDHDIRKILLQGGELNF